MKKKKVPQLGGLNNRNVLSHSLGGQMSKIKVLARWVPCECCERNLLQASPLASGVFLTFFCLSKHHFNLCLHLHMVFSLCACLCPNFPFL